MKNHLQKPKVVKSPSPENFSGRLPLWQLGIKELAGHNIETRGREEVNKLLKEGWLLLWLYTLRYQKQGVWVERPMAILGKPKQTIINASN